jgi:hypothetical protein
LKRVCWLKEGWLADSIQIEQATQEFSAVEGTHHTHTTEKSNQQEPGTKLPQGEV